MRDGVLVTGGAGFIGHHLVAALLARSRRVAIVDNFNDFYSPALKRRNVADLAAHGRVAVHEADILDVERLRAVFADARPSAVVHLAAWAGVRPSIENPALYTAVNVTGTANVLELARASGASAFVLASSSSVYGGSTRVPFSEDDPADRPVSPYGATKRAAEMLAHTYARNFGLRVSCLRFFTVYGPRQRPEMAIHKFARLIASGGEVPIFGDGSTERDYTYVDDIVAGTCAALDHGAEFDVFNLGEARTVRLLDVVRELEAALGRKARLRFLPPQPGDMERTSADVSKAARLLGYRPSTDFGEGIRRFVDWFRLQ